MLPELSKIRGLAVKHHTQYEVGDSLNGIDMVPIFVLMVCQVDFLPCDVVYVNLSGSIRWRLKAFYQVRGYISKLHSFVLVELQLTP
jgi:hypothetical protein